MITIFNNRDTTIRLTVRNASNQIISLSAGDYFRVRFSIEPNTPLLDIKGGVATANGSTVEDLANPFILTLKRADALKLNAGILNMSIDLYKASTQTFYFAKAFILHVAEVSTGEV